MNDTNYVFIIDDDAAVLDSLGMLLEASGYTVATFHGAEDFLEVCTPETHGCIILDVDMPDMDGPALQDELKRRGLTLPVIFLSGHGTIPLTVRALKAGAIDFLTKPVSGTVLLERVQEAMEKSAQMRERSSASRAAAARLSTLTSREREVMNLVVEGYTSKEIAQRLNISYRTVEIHRAHLMQKSGAANMLELARIITHEVRQ
jgi:FixJ family two-component response regulator